MAALTFSSDGYVLAGNLFTPDRDAKNGAFLFIQGWRGHQNLKAAQAIADLGFTTMTYDMRGNQASEGNINDFCRADFIKDATVAYDYLRQQIDETAFIGVVGSSFGGYTAAILSSKRNVHCLSLRAPANYPDDGYDAPQHAQMTPENRKWRERELDYAQTMSLRAIHDFRGKIQIIEAGADDVVAHQTPQNYSNAVSDKSLLTYEIMKDAPHELNSDTWQADYVSRLSAWIQRL